MQLIFQNMEFAIAGLLAVIIFFWKGEHNSHTQGVRSNVLDDIASAVTAVLPGTYHDWLKLQLSYAGMQSTAAVARLASFKVYPALISIALSLVLPFIWTVPLGIAVFFVADLVLISRVKARQAEIAASLPQAIDLMLLCVDAGLGLDATMQRIASDTSSVKNALNDELAKLGRDILLGMDRESAYHELYRRTGVEELKSFAAALNQSSKMGLSVSKILRAQSQFIRMRQNQKAEEKAARLPIWMAFPLWFCIMPSLLLILLGPSVLSFLEKLGR